MAWSFRTFGDKRVMDANKAADAVAKRAEDANRQFDDAKKQAKEEEEAVKTIVAGQFERDNWPQLLKFISTAVPQPDGDSQRLFLVPFDDGQPEPLIIPDLPDPKEVPAVSAYWGKSKDNPGRKAYEEYLHRQVEAALGKVSNPAGESEELPADVEHLIQFNIEGVDSFFCDKLDTFWDQVKTNGKVAKNGANYVRPMTDFDKKPEGAGWIIEIRGWTYHHAQESFIRNTLLENLARLGIQKPKAAAPADGKPPPAAPSARPQPRRRLLAGPVNRRRLQRRNCRTSARSSTISAMWFCISIRNPLPRDRSSYSTVSTRR